MGARGPQPTPTRVKEVLGNPGKRALNKKEIKPRPLVARPAHITGAIAAEWDRAIASMMPGFFTAADVPVLTIYCEALVLRRNAMADVQKDGRMVAGSTGQMVAHPMLREASRQAEIILKCADRLGMSPAARTRLSAPDDETEDETAHYFGRPN